MGLSRAASRRAISCTDRGPAALVPLLHLLPLPSGHGLDLRHSRLLNPDSLGDRGAIEGPVAPGATVPQHQKMKAGAIQS